MNDENLVSLATRTTSEKREIGIKGGKASAAKRKKQKDLGELLEKFMSFQVKSPEAIAQLKTMGFTEEECTNRAAFMMNMQKYAAKGNSAYVKMLIDIQEKQLTRGAELKKMKLENKKLEEEIAQLKLSNEKLKATLEQKSDMEDLTPLADLLKDEDDQAEIEREVEEDEQK